MRYPSTRLDLLHMKKDDKQENQTQKDWITSVSFHPDRPLCAYALRSGIVTLVSLETGEKTKEFLVQGILHPSGDEKIAAPKTLGDFPAPDLGAIQLVPEPNHVLIGRSSGNIEIREFDHGRMISSLKKEHQNRIRCIAWNPLRKSIISGGDDGKVVAWTQDGQVSSVIANLPNQHIYSISAAATKNIVAFAASQIYISQDAKGRVLTTVKPSFADARTVLLSEDGSILCVRGILGDLAFFSTSNGTHLSNTPGFLMRLGVMASSRVFPSMDWRYLAILPGETRLEVWDCLSGQIVYEHGETLMRPYRIL